MEVSYDGYPVYKGLQKPLEFMGIRGKFLYYAAAAIGLGFLNFLLFAFIAGQGYGLLAMIVTSAVGYGGILLKQREGLHAKRKYKGIIIYNNIFKKDW